MPETKHLRDYQDMFFNAEQYFSAVKNEDHYNSDQKYADFKAFLTGRCLVYPIHFQTVHNLFTLHYVFNEPKIAINFHLEKFLKPENHKVSEMQKLSAKVLKHEGWEILDIGEKEFESWTYYERVDNIKGWISAAKERQIEKGIIPRDPPKYVWKYWV